MEGEVIRQVQQRGVEVLRYSAHVTSNLARA